MKQGQWWVVWRLTASKVAGGEEAFVWRFRILGGPVLSHFCRCFLCALMMMMMMMVVVFGISRYGPRCIDRQVWRVCGKLSSVRRPMTLLCGGSFHAPSLTPLPPPPVLSLSELGEKSLKVSKIIGIVYGVYE